MNTPQEDRRSFTLNDMPHDFEFPSDYENKYIIENYENKYIIKAGRIVSQYRYREPGVNWHIDYCLSLYSVRLLYCIDYNDEVENIINNKECRYEIKKKILFYIKENIKYHIVGIYTHITNIYFINCVNDVDLVTSLFYDLELYVKKKI